MRKSLIDTLTACARQDDRVFLITGDAGYGVLDEFKRSFPERFLNLGVAEQNMISFASGLALSAFKVFVYNIVPFVLYRCYEQVRNDICYQNLAVTLIGIGSGITYAPQGVTHYSTEDVGLVRTLPNMVVFSPADPQEVSLCARWAMAASQPVYIRIAKSGEPSLHEQVIHGVDEPIVVRQGQDVAVLFHGSIGPELLRALTLTSYRPRVLSVPKLQPIDSRALENVLEGISTVITVEEHYVEGGLASLVADRVLPGRRDLCLKRIGIKHEFIRQSLDNAGLRDYYGLSAPKIANVIEQAYQEIESKKKARIF